MTTPCHPDPVLVVLTHVVGALLEVFDPGQDCPPVGGGTETVRVFAGDAAPMSAWDAHSAGGKGCNEPFVWVRLMRRYRTKTFPNPTLGIDCELQRAVAIEVGVGRCAVTDQEPRWSDWADEAKTSVNDSHRIEGALCIAQAKLQAQGLTAGTDIINPYGPEGGVVAWTGTIYSTF